ncbi:MAG: hypothetical protein M3291_13145 [Actinomycetota bacterium]|nr:hypothetical protein [Actinomycetota bacterium]HYZ09685.1 hypothetical protein [Pseudonocardiaceae bacterium]
MDHAFRRAVLERLRTVDGIAEHTSSDLPVPVLRTQLHRITQGWRELLTEHQPNAGGRCPVCSGWWRGRRWPCQVWATAHFRLIGDISAEAPPSPGAPQPGSPLGSSFPRAREVEIIDRRLGDAPDRARVDSPPRPPVASPEPETVAIHRAAVIERSPTSPRPRLARRPRG